MSCFMIVTNVPCWTKAKSTLYWAIWSQICELFPRHDKIHLTKHGAALVHYKSSSDRSRDLQKGVKRIHVQNDSQRLFCTSEFKLIEKIAVTGVPKTVELLQALGLPGQPFTKTGKNRSLRRMTRSLMARATSRSRRRGWCHISEPYDWVRGDRHKDSKDATCYFERYIP